MVDLFGASLDVVVVGSDNVGHLVDMLAQMLVVLCLDLILGLQQLRVDSLVVLGLCILLGLLDAVCTVGCVLFSNEYRNGLGVGLDLVELWGDVGLVVWVDVGRCVGADLQIWLVHARGVVV